MDMSGCYKAAIKAYFPKATIVFDHFHVKKMALDHLDEVRRMTSWMMHSRLEAMKRLAKSLREKKAEIFACFKDRLSNAFAEGMNSMIQTAKRKACGFHLFKSFRTAIYLVGGRLKLACPKPFQVYYAK